MSREHHVGHSRRDFLKTSGKIAAAATLASSLPRVHAAESNTIQIALIGCGGRGTGAVTDAIEAKVVPVKLVAMADVFEDRVRGSYAQLSQRYPQNVDVPEERRFVGLDSYKQAMDCLRPGDVAILATPPAFRWVHLAYAIEKGIHVFMEKPVTVDGPSTRRMLELAKKVDEKNLKVGVGLMVRHCRGRMQLYDRIRSGEIGDIIAMRAYRMAGVSAVCGKPEGMSELLFQIRRFHSFIWASGGVFSDYYIHQIDECSWMKDAWPVQAHALGGRHYRETGIDQNFDTYSVEYTYPDGTKLFFFGRNMNGCHNEFASYVHGTKGAAIVSTSAHYPGRVRTFRGHHFTREEMIWAFPQPEPSPYVMEWVDLLEAIVKDKKYNEVERGAIASLVTAMGRMAAHMGRIVTYEEALNHPVELCAYVDQLKPDSPAPVRLRENGTYPVPMPGIITDREYPEA
ncbi:MAG: Gfo/Idh/MocA family oxidoreductase [Thermoguttaceae bacterium]|nr:Gfo/Idh/MocA family oxidoreductase [Thermoguttaceae bacterium]MDW8077393.1 Gfo/Idh/MocA family oxidoreductase [Thermoguttaceae bacterium]